MQNEQEKPKDRGPRINEAIRVKEVRAISDDGSQLGIIPTYEAIRIASEKGLDLVEVQPQLKPPVCKIMDYGKFKYQQKRKEAELKKKQKTVEVKQIEFGPSIDKHDFDFKVKNIQKFIEDGKKCLTTVRFSGREMAHTDLGKDVLNRVIEALKDVASTEGSIKQEGRIMSVMLAPSKK